MNQLSPYVDCVIATEKRVHGAIEQSRHAVRVHRGACSMQLLVAGYDDPGFRRTRAGFR
jgi:hypothetical protein